MTALKTTAWYAYVTLRGLFFLAIILGGDAIFYGAIYFALKFCVNLV